MSFFSRLFRRGPRPVKLMDLIASYFAVTGDGGKQSHRRKQSYRRAVAQWIERGGSPDARRITTEQFVAVRAALSTQYKPRTVESTLARIGTLLRHAGPRTQHVPHGRGLIAADAVPWLGPALSIDVEPRSPIPPDDLAALYAQAHRFVWLACPCSPADFLRAWLVWGYHTGLRRGDLLTRLSRAMLDRESMRLTIAPHKTRRHNRKITLPVNDLMLWHLDRLPESAASAAIFLCSPHQTQSLNVALGVYCRALGVAPITLNRIRATAADAYTRVDSIAGSMILGHTTPERGLRMTLDHYTHACETILRPAQEKIAQPWRECAVPPPQRKLMGGLRRPRNETERRLVERILKLHRGGMSALAIANELARKKVPTFRAMRGGKPSKWHAQTIIQIVERWSIPQSEWEPIQHHHVWTPEQDALVGTIPDRELAERLGCSIGAVSNRRRRVLGRPPAKPKRKP